MGRKSKWSKNQIEKLHECWKAAKNRQEYLQLASEKLPEIPPPVAWSIVRRMSKSDRNWQMTTRQKEREKEEKKIAKEKQKQERLKRREERQQTQAWKEQRTALRQMLNNKHEEAVTEEVGSEFFFCPDMRQYVCRVGCIFRVFSENNQYDNFSHGGPCEECERMDDYIPVIEKIVKTKRKRKNEKQNP